MYELTVLDSARRIAQLATQTSHAVAVEQSEMMEVGESVDKPFSITWPEEMEVCQEPSSVTGASYMVQTTRTAQVQPASASSNAELEIEKMETV